MPRKNRQWIENRMYHITARGNRKNDIFIDEEDFRVYLMYMEESLDYYEKEFEIISYCLMRNHIHIQLKTSTTHMGYFIGRIHNFYAKYFNNKYNYVGHLFQERYASQIIDKDSYAIETSRYIHLNPVRASIVSKPEEYRWSSYPKFIRDIDSQFIKIQYILDYFQEENQRNLYREFVESAIS